PGAVYGTTRLRWTGRPALDRLHLHLIAWREALDPASAAWIEEAKRAAADGSATERAWTTDDLRRLIEERHMLAGWAPALPDRRRLRPRGTARLRLPRP